MTKSVSSNIGWVVCTCNNCVLLKKWQNMKYLNMEHESQEHSRWFNKWFSINFPLGYPEWCTSDQWTNNVDVVIGATTKMKKVIPHENDVNND